MANDGFQIERKAHDALDAHDHFRSHADDFEFEYEEQVLTVRGCVPSFYLKQVLQSCLQRNLDGVRWVNNQVDVVSSDGLSSAGRR